MSYLLLALGLQRSSGLDASALQTKNITFAALKDGFHLLFTSAAHPPHQKEKQCLLLRLCPRYRLGDARLSRGQAWWEDKAAPCHLVQTMSLLNPLLSSAEQL